MSINKNKILTNENAILKSRINELSNNCLISVEIFVLPVPESPVIAIVLHNDKITI